MVMKEPIHLCPGLGKLSLELVPDVPTLAPMSITLTDQWGHPRLICELPRQIKRDETAVCTIRSWFIAKQSYNKKLPLNLCTSLGRKWSACWNSALGVWPENQALLRFLKAERLGNSTARPSCWHGY